MNTRKILFLIVLLLITGSVAVVLIKPSLFGLGVKPAPNEALTTKTSVISVTGGATPAYQNTRSFSVLSSTNKPIQTNNFLAASSTVKSPFNKGYYHLGYHNFVGVSDPTSSKDIPYDIEYIDSQKSFTVAILKRPVMETRRLAEEFLRAQLGLTPTEMCQLRYTISAPYYIDQLFGGENLGFSYCGGFAEGRDIVFRSSFKAFGGDFATASCTEGQTTACTTTGNVNPDLLSTVLGLQKDCRKQNSTCSLIISSGSEPNPQENFPGGDLHLTGDAVDIRVEQSSNSYLLRFFGINPNTTVTPSTSVVYSGTLPTGERLFAYRVDATHWHIGLVR